MAKRASLLVALLLLLASVLYQQGSSLHVMSDDEGNYAYAAWRISLGELPYRDLFTSQMPGFLYLGAGVQSLFGRSLLALRLATMLAMLAAGVLLYALAKELFGVAEALVALCLFLLDANVYHNARFFRPEAYMLALALAGLLAVALGEKHGRRSLFWVAGACFGLSLACKLFGALPLAGCCIYLLYAGWRERRPLRTVLGQGFAVGLPALLILGVLAAVFTHVTPDFWMAVYGHHAMQGAGLTALQRALKALRLYAEFAAAQPLALLLASGGSLLLLRGRKTLPKLLVWQVPTALAFIGLSRELFVRHLTYLAPAVASLAACCVVRLWRQSRLWRAAGAALALAALAWPAAGYLDPTRAVGQETQAAAALIGEITAPDEQVISDYTGYCFAAGRPSTYWGAEISGGAIGSGQIQGAALVKEMAEGNVGAVLINTLGRGRQMVDMVGYAEFRRYVQEHLALVAKVPMGYRQFEVYARRDTMPLKPDSVFHSDLVLTGLRLRQGPVRAGGVLNVDTRWQALQPAARDYSISLRLVDATGRIWAQHDERLQEESSRSDAQGAEIRERMPTSHWEPRQVVLQQHELPVDESVPPGRYLLALRLYDPESGAVVPVRPGNGFRLPTGDIALAVAQVSAGAGEGGGGSVAGAADLRATLARGLALVGCTLLPERLQAGRDLTLALFWKGDVALMRAARLRFRLLLAGRERQVWEAGLAAGIPAGDWGQGQTVLGSYRLPLDGHLAQGSYDLWLDVLDAEGRLLGQAPLPGKLALLARPQPEVVQQQITHRLAGIHFGEAIELLGYDVAPEALNSGESLGLTLYWQCLQPPDGDYTVFVHLLDASAQIRGQHDSAPEGGQAPTLDWRAGDVVIDHHNIILSSEGPAGALQVALGLYDPVTGRRVPLLRDGVGAREDLLLLPTTVAAR
ncbi:MAG: glycosyltransferase family 39 protein [Anaerolineae bacterium]